MTTSYENFPNQKLPGLDAMVFVSKEFIEYNGEYTKFFEGLKEELNKNRSNVKGFNNKIDFVMMYLMKDI